MQAGNHLSWSTSNIQAPPGRVSLRRCCAHFRPPAKLLPLSLKSLYDCLILTPPPHLTLNLLIGGNNLAGVRIGHNTGTACCCLIKTHFKCLHAFLLFLLPVAVVEQFWSIVLLNTFQHFRNKYVCKLHRSTTVTVRCSGVLKKGLNTEFWIDFFSLRDVDSDGN